MNIIFLTMVPSPSLTQRGIYTDLLRQFVKKGHKVFVVYPRERRVGLKTGINKEEGAEFLAVKSLNVQKTSILEKGIGQVLIDKQFKNAINKYWKDKEFGLILYSTPPISFVGTIGYLRRQNPTAKTYLLLKDIFPQNAVDIELLSKTGLRGLLYRYFRRKEKRLYAFSDHIGCMSPANVEYLLKHNPDISLERVEVAPNSIELSNPFDNNVKNEHDLELKHMNEQYYIRSKYGLPLDKLVFVFGGNIGKPQGISFLIDCLNANCLREDCFIVIIGTGTELSRLKAWYNEIKPHAIKVLDGLPKSDYDEFVRTCDVGMIFLDHRFTIPNFPSRLLSYLENKMPVICATDPNTDMGRIAEENGFGYWCESNSVESFTVILNKMIHSNVKAMGERGYEFLNKNYLVENTYNAIISHV